MLAPAETEGAIVLTAYSRVTVVTADRVVDLALPSALPLADVMPQVMRYAAPDSGSTGPLSWTLARVGGSALPLGNTLTDAGVLDGDVLELRPETEAITPARVEDVRDAVEDSVDASGGVWTTRTTGSFAVTGGAVVLALGGVVALLGEQIGLPDELTDLDSIPSAVLAILALIGAVAWASRFARSFDGQVAGAVALGWAGLLGAAVGRGADLRGWVIVIVAVVLVALTAATARAVSDAATGHAAFAVVLLGFGVVAGSLVLSGVGGGQAERGAAVLGVLAIGIVPRISLSIGGLASADYRVRHVGQLELAALHRRYRASNAIVVGSVLGLSATAGLCAVLLERTGRPWDRSEAVAVAVALILRSRLFSRTQHMVGPRSVGLTVLVFVGIRAALEVEDLVPWVVSLAALAMVAGIGLASTAMSDISRARVKRLLNAVEFVVIVVMMVLALGAMGLYTELGGIFS